MLGGLDIDKVQRLAHGQVRQRLVVLVAGHWRQHSGVAVEQLDAAADAQLEIAPVNLYGGGQILRIRHLAGDELAADQVVEAHRFRGGAGQLLRRRADIGWADGLMGFLGGSLAGVEPGLGRQVLVPVACAYVPAAGGDGLAAQAGGVRAHVGDVAGFVQALRQVHRPLDAVAQAGAGGLLQGGGDERRTGPGFGRPVVAGADLEGALAPGLPQPRQGVLGGFLVAGPEVLAAVLDDLKTQGVGFALALQVRKQLPILLRLERPDLPLPLHHQAHRHGLHPARRQAPGHLGPEQGRQLEAHHPVQKAPRLLGLHPVHVQLRRRLERLLNGFARDFVENDAAIAAGCAADGFPQVPGDGFALPVQVGGQIDRIRPVGELGQFLNHLLLAGQHLVMRLPAILGIDPHAPNELPPRRPLPLGGALLGGQSAGLTFLFRLALTGGVLAAPAGRQVTNMADAGLDDVALA